MFTVTEPFSIQPNKSWNIFLFLHSQKNVSLFRVHMILLTSRFFSFVIKVCITLTFSTTYLSSIYTTCCSTDLSIPIVQMCSHFIPFDDLPSCILLLFPFQFTHSLLPLPSIHHTHQSKNYKYIYITPSSVSNSLLLSALACSSFLLSISEKTMTFIIFAFHFHMAENRSVISPTITAMPHREKCNIIIIVG